MRRKQMEVIITKAIHNLLSAEEAMVIYYSDEKYILTKENQGIKINKITMEDDEILQNAEDGQLFFIEGE